MKKPTKTQIARDAVRAAGLTFHFCYADKRANGRRRLKFYIRQQELITSDPSIATRYLSFIRRSLGQKHVTFKKLEFSPMYSELTITV